MKDEILDSEKYSIIKETENLVVVDYKPYVKRRFGYRQRRRIKNKNGNEYFRIDGVVYHHSAGNENIDFSDNLQQWEEFCNGITNWHVWHPDGPKWPGPAYHVVVPYSSLTHNGKLCCVMMNAMSTMTYHTRGANETYIGVCFQGNMYSSSAPSGIEPSDSQKKLADVMWNEWLKEDFRLDDYQLKGHYHFGKPACPGKWLSDFIHGTNTAKKMTDEAIEALADV